MEIDERIQKSGPITNTKKTEYLKIGLNNKEKLEIRNETIF